MEKEETSSPTVNTNSVFLTSAIEAFERRIVATIDVPGAFMQADMDEFVLVRIVGRMAEIMIGIDPKCAKYLVQERGESVIYFQLDKALYGTLRAALLFYLMLSNQLIE